MGGLSVADGGAQTRGLHAPAWLEELVRTTPPSIPWSDVVRFTVTIPAPLTVAAAVGGGIEPSAALAHVHGEIREHESRVLGSKSAGDGAADARGGAGDQDGFSSQTFAHAGSPACGNQPR